MDVSASYKFAAPPQAVWAVLLNPDAIASCLVGCRQLRSIGEQRYQAEVSIGVGAVSGTFNAIITLSDLQPPNSYRLTVDATGKPGFARGSATVTLTPIPDGTDVHVTATSEVGGLIARVGQRLIDSVARMTLDRLFGCLAQCKTD